MNFSTFLNNDLTESNSDTPFIADHSVVSKNLKAFTAVDGTIDWDVGSHNGTITFSITPTITKDEDKDISDILYIDVTAEFDVEASHEKATHDSPSNTEFDLTVKKVIINDVVGLDSDFDDLEDSYKGIKVALKRFETLSKDKTHIKNVAHDIAEELLVKFESELFDDFLKSHK